MRRTRILAVVALAGCPGPTPVDCDDVVERFAEERAEIQQCVEDAECGQVLQGTSCGCTRDLVARLDADTTQFYGLIEEAAANECDLGLSSVCDCPATAGFRCDGGACVHNELSDWPFLPQCRADLGDATTIDAAAVDGDELVVTVAYGGGCEPHEFVLCWPDQAFQESDPVQTGLELFHDGHDDPCDAWLTEDLRLSLSPLKDAWHDAYGAGPGEIRIHLGEFDLAYAFE